MFYSTLKSSYELEIQDGDDGCKTVIVPIARGHDEIRIVSVVSEFAEMVIEGALHWEFSFSIDVIALDDSMEPFRTQDRWIAAAYLPLEVRPRVMEVVCRSAGRLVGQIKPELIFWVTKDRDPPENSLKKHYMLKETLESVGYSQLRHGTDPLSRRFWAMRRNLR
jgi:hypothetical protein